jgi:hypothetical protein
VTGTNTTNNQEIQPQGLTPGPVFKRGGEKTPGELGPANKIRVELNLEKWPIWRPAKSKNPPIRKVIVREIVLPDGNKVTAQVEVGFTDRGDLTTEDQRMVYALIKQWEDRGRSTEQTFYSLQGVGRILKKKWGTNSKDSTTESLLRLRTVPFIWTNSYYDTTKKETIEVLDTFTILSELKIIKRKRDGVVNKEVGYFRFNDFILKNLLANHTKPLLLDTLLAFKSEIAQLLYTHFDLILADKNLYERRSKELFEDIGLQGKSYIKPSKRKQMLEPALKELQAAPLSTGVITSARLDETKDKQDYKVIIRKSRKAALKLEFEENRGDEIVPGMPQAEPPETLIQADELVRYFHQIFHGTEKTKAHPTSKALSQAVTLIAQHGFEQAKYIVDFVKRTAPDTKFDPRAFGGILHYTSQALASYDRAKQREHQERRIAAIADAETKKELEVIRRAEEQLKALAPERHQVLYDSVKAQIHARFPGMYKDGPTLEGMIKGSMLKLLRQEERERMRLQQQGNKTTQLEQGKVDAEPNRETIVINTWNQPSPPKEPISEIQPPTNTGESTPPPPAATAGGGEGSTSTSNPAASPESIDPTKFDPSG